MTLASALFAAVAAVATVIAVIYARKTVHDGEAASAAAAARHQEQIDAMNAATAAAAEQRRDEAKERVWLADHESLHRRLIQLERISDLLREIVEEADREVAERSTSGSRAIGTGPKIAVMCRRLENAVDTLQALGVEYLDKTGELASSGYGAGSYPVKVSRSATDALAEVQEIIRRLHVSAVYREHKT